MLKIRFIFYKISNWEFWNSSLVLFVPSVYFIYLAIKAKSIGFFSASNPSIKNGGFAMESKKDIYDLIPKEYYPKSLFFNANQDLTSVHTDLFLNNLHFPIIIKPDIGLQGIRVEKINNIVELDRYLKSANYDFIIQEYIDYLNEIGIFYCKYPNENKGILTGIVLKEYPTVVGDGMRNIRELISDDFRLYMHLKSFETNLGNKLELILKNGEQFNLTTIGNHARGSKFLDVSSLINKKLTNRINAICSQIPNFYFGRIDLKYNTIEELEAGQNFSIIELNGAASLPTHIYDPKHSLLFAWKEIIKHYKKMYQISSINHQQGTPYLSFEEVILMFKGHLKHLNLLK